jgi:threonine aldolase
MREAMANADVGDDVYGDDPTVKALEARIAELLKKDAAVYMPTGTMTNQVGIRVHTEPGDAVIFDQNAHVYMLEGGAPSAFSGVLPRLLPGVRGIFTAADVKATIGRSHRFFPSTVSAPIRLLCVENTHNIGGGSVWSLEAIKAVAETGREHGLALHLDGARLWHATVATGISEAAYAAPFDTVSVCFSKALGAPVGSCLAGPAHLIARARRFKQQIGGGFRQIVRFRLTGADAGSFVDEAHRRGIHMLPSGSDGVRAVFYLDIGKTDVDAGLAIIRETLQQPARN